MTTGATHKPDNGMGPVQWAFFALMLFNVALDIWWRGTLAAWIVSRTFMACGPIWLAFGIRKGYLRRRPYWTRESWLRYLRLAWMPAAAIVVFFALVLLFDYRTSMFGKPASAARRAWIIIVMALMLIGVTGLIRALDWMIQGDPSQQFIRTRWFQRQRPKVTA
jgi:hypothetical protein